MLDDEWFDRWQSHDQSVQLWPGDAILVDIKVIRKNNQHKGTSSVENEIIKVVRVIPQENIEQTEMDLSNE